MNFDLVTDYDQYLVFIDTESDEYKTPEAQLWRRFLSESRVRICMDALKPVGASNGELTSFICYDVNIDSKTVHCFPVSEADAKTIMGDSAVLGNDVLNCKELARTLFPRVCAKPASSTAPDAPFVLWPTSPATLRLVSDKATYGQVTACG
jgi:hypothetical protein